MKFQRVENGWWWVGLQHPLDLPWCWMRIDDLYLRERYRTGSEGAD